MHSHSNEAVVSEQRHANNIGNKIFFYSLDTVTLEMTVWVLRLIRLLTQHCPKPPGIVDNGAEPVGCSKHRECAERRI